VENVPFLTGKSIVTIQQLATATVRLIEIKASRTNGDRGTITVGTDNGGNSAATIAFSWCKEEA
jgi:hypothetical protein